MEPSEALREWHDFYVLIGTASGTLIGLMFVAASIAATAMGERYRPGMEAFITPTVAHFSAVLFVCLLVMAPTHTRVSLGVVTLAGGAIGLGYCVRVRMHVHRSSIASGMRRSRRWVTSCWRQAARLGSWPSLRARLCWRRRWCSCCSPASGMPGT